LDLLYALAYPNKMVASGESKEFPKPTKVMPLLIDHVSKGREGNGYDDRLDKEELEEQGELKFDSQQQQVRREVDDLPSPIVDVEEIEEDKKKP
jgi:hypothetical protein